MGIKNLLPALREFTKTDAHISEFQGQAIAVDTSSWLHKGVYNVAKEYVEANEAGRICPRAVDVASNYVLQRCHELIFSVNIPKIFLVLDGQHRCPLKAVTNEQRKRDRAANLQKARQATTDYDAHKAYSAAIRISHPFTQAVLKIVRQNPLFRQQRIVLVQSPNEADAQLVHLAVKGHVKAIITEDSDVVVYAASARCPVAVLYKFNRKTGNCDVLRMNWLWDDKNHSSKDDTTATRASTKVAKASSKNKTISSKVWRVLQARERSQPGAGRRLFVQACTLAGCDYCLNDLPGVGQVKAFSLLIEQAGHLAPNQRFESIVRGRITPRSTALAYVEKLRQAEAVFYYHPVRKLSLMGGELAWITRNEPEAPAFPVDNLAILGNPDELKHLPVSGSSVAPSPVISMATSGAAAPSSQLASGEEPSGEAADDLWLSASSGVTETTKPVESAKPKTRRPIVNPYQQRKRPLVTTSQNSNQQSKRSFGEGFNLFARFRHIQEKENQTDVKPDTFVPPCCDRTLVPAEESQGNSSELYSKDEDVEEQDDKTDVTEVASIASPTTETSQSATKKRAPQLQNGETDEQSVSSVESPVRTLSQSPYFSGGERQKNQLSSESFTKEEEVAVEEQNCCSHLNESSKTLPQKATQESLSSQNFEDGALPCRSAGLMKTSAGGDFYDESCEDGNWSSSSIVKKSSMYDFYDEWLSPKAKPGTAYDDAAIEEDSPPQPSKKPIGPQGALRFRLAGVITQKRTLVTRKSQASRKSSLSSKKRNLVYGMKGRALGTNTALGHFRASKQPEYAS